jgi:tetratricopeptide (TPR) repeat protein
MFRILFAVAATLAAGSAVASAPRISFERVIPPPHGLRGAQELTLVYAIGDNESVRTFLDVFLDATNRSGLLRVHDATASRQKPPHGVHLRVTSFACRMAEHVGEGNAYDFDGKRIRRKHRYIDATCSARLELQEAAARAAFDSFEVRGEGTSPRVERITRDEAEIARDQAARYAALAAAEQITPRRIRETIVLIEEAPEFAGAIAMVESGRLDAARRMWEGAVLRNRSSASLRHNLGAVCEALGDIPRATSYYEEAQRLAPGESRYRIELEMFRRRNGIAAKR